MDGDRFRWKCFGVAVRCGAARMPQAVLPGSVKTAAHRRPRPRSPSQAAMHPQVGLLVTEQPHGYDGNAARYGLLVNRREDGAAVHLNGSRGRYLYAEKFGHGKGRGKRELLSVGPAGGPPSNAAIPWLQQRWDGQGSRDRRTTEGCCLQTRSASDFDCDQVAMRAQAVVRASARSSKGSSASRCIGRAIR